MSVLFKGRTATRRGARGRKTTVAAMLAVVLISAAAAPACAPEQASQVNGAAQEKAKPLTAAPTSTAAPAAAAATPETTASAASADTVGDLIVTPITHASLQLEQGGRVIHVDPTSAGDYAKAKQADLVLVTDIHGDHLDPAAIARVRKAGAPVVAPAAAAEKIEGATLIANGETKTVAGVSIEAVAMYNLGRGPQAGQLFHTKGRGNGYILTLGARRIYIAGDTECTPEMRALRNIDIAFIPMNLPYTMPPAEAAACVKEFKPKVVYPYHHRGQNPEEFKTALAGEPVEVRLLNWYPKGQ